MCCQGQTFKYPVDTSLTPQVIPAPSVFCSFFFQWFWSPWNSVLWVPDLKDEGIVFTWPELCFLQQLDKLGEDGWNLKYSALAFAQSYSCLSSLSSHATSLPRWPRTYRLDFSAVRKNMGHLRQSYRFLVSRDFKIFPGFVYSFQSPGGSSLRSQQMRMNRPL